MAFSDLSYQQYNVIANANAKINVLDGSVRSGKNFALNMRLAMYLKHEPVGDNDAFFCMAGTSKQTVYRNIIKDLAKLIPAADFKYSAHSGTGRAYKREFFVLSSKDDDDYKTLRGATLAGSILTEGSLANRKFFDELIARNSKGTPNPCILVDTNPDNL